MSDTLRHHPLADIFPPMEGAEFNELVADIKQNGLIEPIILLDDQILDGRNRFRACVAAGVEPTYRPFTGEDPGAFVISANIRRRHLTHEQKLELIEKLLSAHPNKSDRQIAETTKTDHKTVGKVRRAKEARGEIPHVETKTDTKGRQQPSKRGQSRTAADASTTATPPDPNPLIAAWDKASRAQRQELVTSRKLEVLRAQQQIGVSATPCYATRTGGQAHRSAPRSTSLRSGSRDSPRATRCRNSEVRFPAFPRS